MLRPYAVYGRDEGYVEFLGRVATRQEMIALAWEQAGDWDAVEYEWTSPRGLPETITIAVNGKLLREE